MIPEEWQMGTLVVPNHAARAVPRQGQASAQKRRDYSHERELCKHSCPAKVPVSNTTRAGTQKIACHAPRETAIGRRMPALQES
jgi:hypothetical protein